MMIDSEQNDTNVGLGMVPGETEIDRLEQEINELREQLNRKDEVVQEAHFLLERLNEFDQCVNQEDIVPREVYREWNGHVIPPISRLEDLLNREQDHCEHEWVDASNEVVSNTEMCTKCYAIRPANGYGTRTNSHD